MSALEGSWERVAGVLHDVVEDTPVTLDQLGSAGFPAHLLHTLDCLTHRDGETYTAYIERVAGDATAVRVKLADLGDNLGNCRGLDRTPAVVARIRRYERARARLRQGAT